VFQSLWRRTVRAVMIVSQDPAEPLITSDFLRQPDIRLLTALPDESALDLACRERPSLIVEDLAVPAEAGLAFCRDLAGHVLTRSIPLILVTPDALWSAARETRADVLLTKPLEQREFYDAVRRFLPMPKRRTRRLYVNLRFIYRVDGRTSQAFSRDLSTQGAFLKTDRLLPLGTRIALEFSIPGIRERIECEAIVRCTSSTAHVGDPGGVGIEFLEMADGDRESLTNFIGQQL